ncbi:Sulfur carrier protein TusA [Candidatus Lokiarchaeum ossiferum]|uniref:Sulfur carrier protein TusA n=1 Tax=Candidatus Lokiarchaeum ossiferum TaxID=2951803 RepID=A0ABY6HQC9_9ARCH|nr:Sulfur carrier protein TusA [Candidatus Lokiarchaeum sp. B-35]
MKFDAELDTCGLVCPVPALKTKKRLRSMQPGQILKVITDYKPASQSVPRDLAKTKHKFLGTEILDDDEGWELFFECVK